MAARTRETLEATAAEVDPSGDRVEAVPADTVRASVDTTNGDPNGPQWVDVADLATGNRRRRHVVFHATADNLVADDGNSTFDIYVRSVSMPTIDSVTPPRVERSDRSAQLVGVEPGHGTRSRCDQFRRLS